MPQSFVRAMSKELTHIKNKKTLAPKLRFKEFKDGWRQTVLSEISDKITDGTHDTPRPTKNGVPYLTAIHVKDGFIDFANSYFLPQEEHDQIFRRCNPQFGDLLMVNIGAGTATCAMVNVDFEFSLKNVALVKPNKSKVDSSYLSQLQRKNSKRLFKELTSGGAQPFLSLKEIGKLRVSIPPLPEQQKIASFLSAVDEKIQQLTRKKELLEQYKKGVMQQLFSGKLRFKDENGKTYPKWEFKNGDELFESITDKNHNSDLPILAITQEHGAVPRDLFEYSISVTDKSVESYKVVQIGDFIISLRSFQGGIEYSSYKGICSPAYIILRPTIKLERSFYKQYFKTENYIRQLNKNIEGIRDGKMISFKYFSEVKLPFPSVQEQQKISSFISAMDAKIQSVSNQLGQAQKFKKGLLQQMFV